MKRFTDAGRACIANQNYYAGLTLALTLPDICGSLEDPGAGKSAQRYKTWCNKWVQPRFTNKGKVWLTSDDIWRLRCSLIHSGSSDLGGGTTQLHRFEFYDHTAGGHLNLFVGNIVNGVNTGNVLQLKADLFSTEMFTAADEWNASVSGNPDVQGQKSTLLAVKTAGDTMLGGMVVVGGLTSNDEP